MRKHNYWLWLFVILLATGCAKPRTLEQIGLVTTKGFDIGDNGIIKGTMIVLQVDPSAKQKITTITTDAFTGRGIRVKGDLASSKKLLSGQMRVVLFSEKLGRKGIKNLTDTLIRDPSISDLTYLAIVEGESRELLQVKNEQFPDISQHIYKQIDHNVKWAIIPSSTLHETLHDHYSAGRDPVMPILKKDGMTVDISGLALFKNDKMVGKVSQMESYYLKTIRTKIKSGEMEIPISGDSLQVHGKHPKHKQLAVTLDTVSSRSKIKLINKKNLEFNLKLKLDVRLQEINSEIDLKNPKNIHLLEKAIASKIKTDIEKLIAYCQTKKTDPIGFGEVYRSTVRHSQLTRDKWHQMFPHAKVNVNIQFTIVKTGVVE